MAAPGSDSQASRSALSFDLLIGGRWVRSQENASKTLYSPGDGELVSSVAVAGPSDVDAAITAAAMAFEKNRWSSLFERAKFVDRIGDVILGQVDTLARHVSLEHGKPLAEAQAEVELASSGFHLAAEEARRLTGETLPVGAANKRVMTFREPRGVFVVLTPWNFPFNIPAEYIGPALASGNAVVFKPASSTSGIGALLARCILEAEVPVGLFNLLTCVTPDGRTKLLTDRRVVGVGLTGSTEVGETVSRLAAGKEQIMELGGNGPIVVLDDADVDAAVPAIGNATFYNAGQSCAAGERILAHKAVHDRLVEGLADYAHSLVLGHPLGSDTTIGPVHTEDVASRMDAHIADALSRGASMVAGGRRSPERPTGLYYEPTVLGGVSADAALQSEETFGPIAAVTPLDDDEALLALANACDYGLSGAVFTRDLGRAFWFAERMQNGQVVVNDSTNYWEIHTPFGGWAGKASGRGRLGGKYVFEAFTQLKSISIDTRR